MAIIPLWSTNHETNTGSFWGWPTGQEGSNSPWDSGTRTREISKERAHSGVQSAKCTVDATLDRGGVRLAHAGHGFPRELLPNAYYSAWFYVPRKVVYQQACNLFQWKRYPIGPTYSFDIVNRPTGEMYLRFTGFINKAADKVTAYNIWESPTNLPVGKWFHLECFYKWSMTTTGEVRGWVNGAQVFRLTGVATEFDGAGPAGARDRQWSCNNYVTGNAANAPLSNPAITSIYIDDAAIHSGRVFGRWPG